MKEYYEKTVRQLSEQIDLLNLGFEFKAKEIGTKLTEVKNVQEREELVEELLELAKIVQNVRFEYEHNLKQLQEAGENKNGENV